jgi:Tfp pilus assembly protein PilE
MAKPRFHASRVEESHKKKVVSLMFDLKCPPKHASAGFSRTELLTIIVLVVILEVVSSGYNIQEASVRTKVVRALSDMRSLATAIETYSIDQKHYPAVTEQNQYPLSARLRALTTPIAYLNHLPSDMFKDQKNPVSHPSLVDTYYYDLKIVEAPGNSQGVETQWRLISAGPDRVFEYGAVVYDTTNGTKSRGDLVWTGGFGKPQ